MQIIFTLSQTHISFSIKKTAELLYTIAKQFALTLTFFSLWPCLWMWMNKWSSVDNPVNALSRATGQGGFLSAWTSKYNIYL